jgi:TolB-like protein
MGSDSDQPVPPPLRRPSVFISYASEDRAAARRLRDTLDAAGIDVWYDENELGGGDAWDQKIRRQIRECDYFMALVSATTEARKEGYFRREWRLATERTLDMADDVLFLLPVALDGTSESGARVPDKFLAVQWLRAPDGQSTPALDALIGRLAAGDHAPPRRPAVEAPRPASAKSGWRKSREPAAPPPPIPPFPPVPQQGGIWQGLHFVVEILKWAIVAARLLFKRLPKWARVLVVIWIVLLLLPRYSSDDESPRAKSKAATKDSIATKLDQVDAALALKEAARQLEQKAGAKDTGNLGSGFAKAGADIARAISTEISPAEKVSRQFTVIPFATGIGDPPAAEFAGAVFKGFYRQLATARGDIVGISLEPAESDESAIALGRRLGTAYLVAPRLKKEADETVLTLRLLDIKDGTVIWSSSCPVTDDPDTAATRLAGAVLAAWPKP